MPKRGENIYKRKDGRWEGRYIKQRHNGGKPQYGYIYGKTYSEVKEKIVKARAGLTRAGEPSSTPLYYKDIIRDWLSMARIRTKESTYSRYVYGDTAVLLAQTYDAAVGERVLYHQWGHLRGLDVQLQKCMEQGFQAFEVGF